MISILRNEKLLEVHNKFIYSYVSFLLMWIVDVIIHEYYWYTLVHPPNGRGPTTYLI